jgi:hypothetical protein
LEIIRLKLAKFRLNTPIIPTFIHPLLKSDANSKSNWEEQVALSHLSALDKETVLRLLQKHASIWSENLGELKRTVHHIDTGEIQPPILHHIELGQKPVNQQNLK